MHTREELLKKSNRQANRYNIYAMIVILILLVICEVLNELDIFLVPKMSMRPTVGAIAGLFLIPVLIYYIHDKWLKKEPTILEWDGFKIIIIIISYIGVLLAAVVLSFHATLLLTVPPIMAAQYRNKKKLIIVVLIATVISVPLAIYGSYFFGLVDKNLILVEVEDVIDIDVQKRFESATAERMFVILYHHILPRWICIILIDVLVVAIAQRNARMLDDQMELSDQVKHEMERRTQMQNRVIGDLAAVIETRDAGTGEHIIRTKKYVSMIAREMRKYPKYADILTEEYINQIENSSPLHDVGKIAIRDAILLKPGKLTSEEFDEMKKHSEKGGEMINNIFSNLDDESFFKTAYDIAIAHHEKWDGSGYPKGLKGEEIPLSARIMAIADVFDALTSERCYKSAIPADDAFNIIVEGRGTHFDPDIIDIVIKIKDDFISYVNESKENS